MRFKVYWTTTLLGETELELGAPPMGVASGRLYPFPEYYKLRKTFVSQYGQRLNSPSDLSVHLSGGDRLAAGLVFIEDYDIGEEMIEVSACGMASPAYAELFPDHCARYKAHFRGNRVTVTPPAPFTLGLSSPDAGDDDDFPAKQSRTLPFPA